MSTKAIVAQTSTVSETKTYNDPMAKRLWYIDNGKNPALSMDLASVWEDYTGKGVKVGVIDTQIDFRHTDLSRAYDTSLDYNFALDTDAVTINSRALPEVHGTAVAGVISAQAGNGVGTTGIASGATLVGYGIDYSSSTVVDDIVAALKASASLDVVNCSWSFVDNYYDNFAQHSEYQAALVEAVSKGRSGLGTSIVFAAGNAGSNGSSNYHNFQNSPYTVAVGAVDQDGHASSFTSVGANVLVSAAGSNVTTTVLNDRYDAYDGTSFAAPAVSAVIALMLEANPNLGYRDIQEILAYSAQRTGLSDDPGKGDGWRTNGATNYNGGGMHYSDSFGYGFVNAHDAVRLAETWTQQQTYDNLGSISKTVTTSQQLVAGSKDHISVQVQLTDKMDVEHVQLSLNLNWVNTGDLDIYLTSPDGTQVRLVYDVDDQSRNGTLTNFTFTSVASMGEQAAGTWTIDIYNRDPSAVDKSGAAVTGKLKSVTLTVTGNAGDDINDTYIYTDEFGQLYSGADLAARKVLNDGNGGIDAINLAAVTSNSVVDLTAVSKTVIAGIELSLTANTIENVYTGDGNDTITGSSAANLLSAGRGDDVIYYSLGNDTIDGGAGSDKLVFGNSVASFSSCLKVDGDLVITSTSGAETKVCGIETFVFADGTYSLDALIQAFANGTPATGSSGGDTGASTGGGTGGTDTSADTSGGSGSGSGGGSDPSDGHASGGTTSTLTNPFDEANHTFAAQLTGTSGADRLVGGASADLIHGGAGDDKLLGEAGNDMINGDAGNDKVTGGAGDDVLMGGAGDDLINADDGNDWLLGGAGTDRLYGGTGADTFVVDLSDLGPIDTVYDFNLGTGDRVVVAGASAAADATFGFVSVSGTITLQMHDSSGLHDLLRIKGDDLGNLAATSPEVLMI